jgi:hypothetical protein
MCRSSNTKSGVNAATFASASSPLNAVSIAYSHSICALQRQDVNFIVINNQNPRFISDIHQPAFSTVSNENNRPRAFICYHQ